MLPCTSRACTTLPSTVPEIWTTAGLAGGRWAVVGTGLLSGDAQPVDRGRQRAQLRAGGRAAGRRAATVRTWTTTDDRVPLIPAGQSAPAGVSLISTPARRSLYGVGWNRTLTTHADRAGLQPMHLNLFAPPATPPASPGRRRQQDAAQHLGRFRVAGVARQLELPDPVSRAAGHDEQDAVVVRM
jgi:hypothetical protein